MIPISTYMIPNSTGKITFSTYMIPISTYMIPNSTGKITFSTYMIPNSNYKCCVYRQHCILYGI